LFDEAFKYGDGAKLWGYVGTSAELLCVEYCKLCNAKSQWTM
jgi:hypothetical protein